MSVDLLAAFLRNVRADGELQQALREEGALRVAVATARAAGLEVRAEDLRVLAAATSAGEGLQQEPDERELVDLDGDGSPDVIRTGGQWRMIGPEEW